MRCSKCGRELKDPESIKMGIGPVCRAKPHEEGRQEFLPEDTEE